MSNSRAATLVALVLLVLPTAGPGSARARAADVPCGQSLAARIPARSATALNGSRLAPRLNGISDDAREALIKSELLAGNIPEFLRHLQPVTLTTAAADGVDTHVTVCVMPDYLALGSDDDYVLMPMRLETALTVAERYGFTLPTPKLVDAIYAESAVRLSPQPLPASAVMRSTAYYEHHNDLIRNQRAASSTTMGSLISGHKKDLVLTNRLWQNLERVAIYGWHRLDGSPIQPLSTVHGWHYADYSHGARLVSTEILVDGRPQSLYGALQDSRLASILSSEGLIRNVLELVDRLKQPRPAAVASLMPAPRIAAITSPR